jgi:hypothetical protein
VHARSTGLRRADAQGNFVFFDTGGPLPRFQERMLARGIKVGRHFEGYDSWARVTIGLRNEVDRFLARCHTLAPELAQLARSSGSCGFMGLNHRRTSASTEKRQMNKECIPPELSESDVKGERHRPGMLMQTRDIQPRPGG